MRGIVAVIWKGRESGEEGAERLQQFLFVV